MDTVTKCNLTESNSTIIKVQNNNKDNTCLRLSGSVNGTSTSKNIWGVFNTQKNTGLRMKLAKGDKCKSDPSKNYEITIELTCNENFKPNTTTLNFHQLLQDDLNNQCTFLIEGESKEACPQQYRYIFQSLMHQYRYVVIAVFVPLGIFISLFGARFKNTSIVSISYFAIISIIMALFTRFYPVEDMKTVYIALGVSAIAGVGGSILFVSFIQVFIIGLALFSGYSLGVEVYSKYILYFDWQEDAMYWVFIVVFAILIGVFTYFIFKQIFTIFTTVCGGYFIIKGCAVVFGGMAHVTMIRDLKKFKETEGLKEHYSYFTYLYLAIWVLIIILGSIKQFRTDKKKESHDEKEVPLK